MSDEMGTTITMLTESGSRLAGTEQVKHTPGPWRIMHTTSYLDEEKQWVIPGIAHCGNGELSEANARLIAAAPDMLAALKPLAFCDARRPPYGVKVDDWTGAVEAARVALSKAQGRTP